MKTYLFAFLAWLPLGLAITGISALVYLTVQQDLRQGANDPQIQMAEDAASAFQEGADPVSLVPNDSVEISTSLSPYIMIFDEQGDLVVGNAALHSTAPSLPQGVFDTRAWSAPVIGHHLTWMVPPGENRFTWQPEPGVRSAVVLVHVVGGQGGFVAAGRSLREVEKREDQLSFNVFIAWILTMAGSLFLTPAYAFLKQKQA